MKPINHVLLSISMVMPILGRLDAIESRNFKLDQQGAEPQVPDFDLQLAEAGNAASQAALGTKYFNGWGGKRQDFVQAVKWFRKAAEQGNAEGEAGLGSCYSGGKGVTQDYAEAVKWFRKAAMQGDLGAQGGLASSYQYGEGVPRDLSEAYVWLNIAAANEMLASDPEIFNFATQWRNQVAKKLSPQAILRSQSKARKLSELIKTKSGKKRLTHPPQPNP